MIEVNASQRKNIQDQALLRSQPRIQIGNARQPLALTLPLKINGDSAHTLGNSKIKLPQPQADAKGVNGRAIRVGFAAVHESGCGPSATSMMDARESAFEGIVLQNSFEHLGAKH